jgi:hypothetical protein
MHPGDSCEIPDALMDFFFTETLFLASLFSTLDDGSERVGAKNFRPEFEPTESDRGMMVPFFLCLSWPS